MKPISHYIRQPGDDWTPLPNELTLAPLGQEENACAFLNQKEGLHFMASVIWENGYHVIHVSIGQINALRPDLTVEQLHEYSLSQAPALLELFFPGRGFSSQTRGSYKPTVHHYFSLIEEKDR